MSSDTGPELVVVATGHVGFGTPPEVLESVLKDSGIACILEIESPYPAAAVGMASVARSYRLLVRREDEEIAKELLGQAQVDSDDDEDEYVGLRRGLTSRPRATNPPVVLGGIAIVLVLVAIGDVVIGSGMWWLFIPLAAFASFVAWQSAR